MNNYPKNVAREICALRPDLCAQDAVAAVLTADPTLTAEEVISILEEAIIDELAAKHECETDCP